MSSMITKKLRRWEIANFLVAGIAGPLLHFAYEWSGQNRIIAAFSAVNESTWEHMKIFFLPLFLMTLLEMMVFTERYRNFLAVKTVAVLAGTVLIPVLYYTYTGVWGRGSMAADIAIFYIAAAFSSLVSYLLLEKGKLVGSGKQVVGLLLLWAVAFAFVWFTYRPPHIALFYDAVSGRYGL